MKGCKSQNQSKKTKSNDFFNLFRLNSNISNLFSTSFWSLSINFELFDGILIWWKRFCRDILDSTMNSDRKSRLKTVLIWFQTKFRPKLIQWSVGSNPVKPGYFLWNYIALVFVTHCLWNKHWINIVLYMCWIYKMST